MTLINNKKRPLWFISFFIATFLVTTSSHAKQPKKESCLQQSNGEWIDRVQASTYSHLCDTTRWVDSLFGSSQKFDAANFRGKVTIGFVNKEDEELDPKIRLRIDADLPNMSKRFNGFIGRLEQEDYIRENSIESESIINKDGISSGNDDSDASWLIGLGYNRFPDHGFSFSAGGKFSGGFQPYLKIKHRHLSKIGKPHHLRFNQLVYLEKEDGYGASTSFDYSYELNEADLIRWGSGLKYTEELRQWEGSTSLIWYHRLGDNRGFSARGFFKDYEYSPTKRPEYGYGFTYRRPLHRDWLRLIVGIENRWITDSTTLKRDARAKLGVQIEMLFGKQPNRIK